MGVAMPLESAGEKREEAEVKEAAKDLLDSLEVKEAKKQTLVKKLSDILESYDLAKKEILYKAITEEVKAYNQKHPEVGLTVPKAYVFITGDSELAHEEVRKAQELPETRKRERGERDFYFDSYIETGGEEKGEEKIDELIIEKGISKFFELVKQMELDNVDLGKLNEFLMGIKELAIEDEGGRKFFYERIQKVVNERVRELQKFPQNAESVIKALISSIKSIDNRVGVYEYPFDERQIKSEILKNYSIEQKEKVPEDKEIMSNVEGRIKEITFVLAMTGYAKDNWKIAEDYYHTISEIMRAKKNEPDFNLKCVHANMEERFNFEKFLEENNITYPPPEIVFVDAADVNNNERYDFWVRDGAVRKNDGTIIEPKVHYAPGVSSVYENLIPIEGTDIQQSELSFQGGNMRATEEHLFIGYDDIINTIYKNPEMTKGDFQTTIELFEREFGKKVMVIGLEKDQNGQYKKPYGKQGVFHIDMCITPLGGKDVIVAQSVNESSKQFLDNSAEQLKAEGFNVIRMPYLEIGKFKITYNNSLVEKYTNQKGEEVKKVYLPQYFAGSKDDPVYSYEYYHEHIDLEKMNKDALEIYQSQGFEVIPVNMSVSIIGLEGSLNCITFESRERG